MFKLWSSRDHAWFFVWRRPAANCFELRWPKPLYSCVVSTFFQLSVWQHLQHLVSLYPEAVSLHVTLTAGSSLSYLLVPYHNVPLHHRLQGSSTAIEWR
jgi:hypothetical protein